MQFYESTEASDRSVAKGCGPNQIVDAFNDDSANNGAQTPASTFLTRQGNELPHKVPKIARVLFVDPFPVFDHRYENHDFDRFDLRSEDVSGGLRGGVWRPKQCT